MTHLRYSPAGYSGGHGVPGCLDSILAHWRCAPRAMTNPPHQAADASAAWESCPYVRYPYPSRAAHTNGPAVPGKFIIQDIR